MANLREQIATEEEKLRAANRLYLTFRRPQRKTYKGEEDELGRHLEIIKRRVEEKLRKLKAQLKDEEEGNNNNNNNSEPPAKRARQNSRSRQQAGCTIV